MNKPLISRRGESTPASPIRKLSPLAVDARRRGIHVHHLNIGQPDLETPPELRNRLATMDERVIAYTPSCGTESFVDALRHYYGLYDVDLAPSHIIATTGGSEAILFAMLAACDPGDEAIVVEPFYTNYSGFAALSSVTLRPVTAHGEDGFHLPDDSAFEAAVTPQTRMIILCNPNNPTGTVLRADELERIAHFCRERGLFLVVDEVYREFVYDGRKASTALSLRGYDEVVIVVDSLSKRYSACGLRLGCLVTRNAELYDACNRMAQARLSAPGLAQAVAVGIRDLGADYLESVRATYEARRDVLYSELQTIDGLFLRRPEGAFYFVARLPITDSEDFAAWLLRDFSLGGQTVMVSPAPGFYATPGLGRDEVRIAYVLGEDSLRTSVRILAEALRQYGGAGQRSMATLTATP